MYIIASSLEHERKPSYKSAALIKCTTIGGNVYNFGYTYGGFF